MKEKKLIDHIGPKLIAAIMLAVTAYITAPLKLEHYQELIDFLITNAPAMKDNFLHTDFFRLFPMAPVVLLWLLIGATIYLVYYSLRVIYNDISTMISIGSCDKTTELQKEKINISKVKRVLLHGILIVYYLAAGFITIFVTFPGSELIRIFALSSLGLSFPFSVIVPLIPATLFCLTMIEVFARILGWIFSLLVDVDCEVEHNPIEV